MVTDRKTPGPRRRPKGSTSRGRPPSAEVLDAGDAEEGRDEPQEESLDALGEPSVEELQGDEGLEISDEALVPLARAKALSRRGATGLVPSRDPMQAYMAEVIRHPLLTREEELRLARQYRESGDVKAAYRLVASNLRLVVKLAHEYHRNPLALLDLIQEGNIGLMQAVKKYDPERGVKLSSYAAWWIRAYILRYIMDNWKVVKLGTTEAQRKLFFKLRQEQERLLSQGFEATPKLLAERLSVSEKDVVEMDQRLGNDEVSLDAPMGGEDSGGSRHERVSLPSAQQPADERLGNAQLQAVVREALSRFAIGLNEKERYIFEKRLTAEEPVTLQEIGTHFGVSRERARQLEAALIGRMREHLRETLPDFELMSSRVD